MALYPLYLVVLSAPEIHQCVLAFLAEPTLFQHLTFVFAYTQQGIPMHIPQQLFVHSEPFRRQFGQFVNL
jgi:hypothetical protein